MRNKHCKLIAIVLAALLVVGLFPANLLTSAEAVESAGNTTADDGVSDETAGDITTQETERSSDDLADWTDTGLQNADGTPVTAQQGDTAGNSGAVTSSDTSVLSEDTPDSYTLTLDLDGGQVNGLQGAGWTRSSASSYTWYYTVTAGDNLTPDDTLGGLLPSAPYREGYRFQGWNVDGNPATGDAPVPVTADTTVTARWEVTEYTVTFRDGSASQTLWTVQVPYSATLWTDRNETPWTADGLVWNVVEGYTDQWTASVNITLGGVQHPSVEVTRHLAGPAAAESDRYYYSFRIDGLYYFTYGGAEPAKSGYSFTGWRMTVGGTGFAVTQDSTFTAQFQAGTTYIVNVYYYYADGSRVEDITTQTLTYAEQELQGGTIKFQLGAQEKAFYSWELSSGTNGVSVQGNQVTVNVDEAYAGSSGATKFLALTVVYSPVDITYTVEYYQQNVGTDTGYTKVGTTGSATAPYGSLVSVADRPDLGADVSFDGFEAASGSQSALRGGVLLETGTTNVDFDTNNESAVIRIYYDRASYFIYFQTGTSEVYLEPEKVQYGGAMPKLEDNIDKLHRTGYQQVTRSDISWMYLDENGVLQEIPVSEQNGTMPAYDVYAVIHWRPATTSIQIVYWVESRNSASFQNAYTRKVENVATEAELTVNLEGNSMTISGGMIAQGNTIVATGFQELIQQRYGDDQYATFFSYSSANTKTSPGNVANAQATDSGSVQEGAITQDQFRVKVNGDGSTTINVYYTRNLYTLEFVLGRSHATLWGTQYEVATATPGTFGNSTWTTVSGAVTFQDFQSGVDVSTPGGTYGNLNVMKEYRITGSALDRRAPVGRYGTKSINGYNCYVYTLTARFEAEISTLWPTANNMTQRFNNISYISMGTDANSYYRVVFTSEIAQHNVLNVYSTMDYNILTVRSNASSPWTATADTGNGTVAHQMVAYWSGDAAEYHYYFLYEVLDTTLTPGPGVSTFDPSKADQGQYEEGQTVSYNGKVYVYTTSFSAQYSTSTKSGQNQPAKQGFSSEGKLYVGNDEKANSNIYFFYARESYNLSIQNISAEYPIPKDILTQNFDCLENYGEGVHTLAQLGWHWNDTQDTIYVRYGGYLSPLGESEIIDWLTGAGGLKYPIPTSSENQYYFSRWYRNAGQSVWVDWSDYDLSTIKSNVTLYAGWFTPRFTTTYVLNGGSWVDQGDNAIRYTLIAYTDGTGQHAFFYYPHQTQQQNATLYWYIQSQASDRLYVDNLYTCKVSDVLQWDAATQHWAVKGGLDLEVLKQQSTLDTTGTRLVNSYYCYMGQDGQDPTYSHEGYVNINASLDTVLQEPQNPVRNGYNFSGWFYFDEVTDPETSKIYLADVLGENQGLL